MKKSVAYILIGLIVLLVVGGGAYFVLSNKEKEPDNKVNETDNKDNKIEDGIKLLDAKKDGNKIVQTYEIALNDKKQNVEVVFSTKKESAQYTSVTGNFKNTNIYYTDNIFNENEDMFTENYIKKNFSEDNFNIIKGEDSKSYLLLNTYVNGGDAFNTSELMVFNDELTLISKNIISIDESPDFDSHDGFVINNFSGNIPCEFGTDENIFYSRTFKKVDENLDGGQYVKIEKNSIYFLFPKLDSNLESGTLEERKYSIKDNKLEYVATGKTYKITSICQQI